MKKTGMLHHRISEVIASMGHGDMLVIADAGLPVPEGVERIDLAVTRGLPGIVDVTRVIASELQVESIVLAEQLVERNRELAVEITDLFPGSALRREPHDRFKLLTADARAIVRTGEHTAYANVILVSGVTF